MPLLEITSPHTGKTYQIEGEGEPTEDDIEEIGLQLDADEARRAGVDPAVLNQGPLGTAGNSFPQTFAKVGTGAIQGAADIIDKTSQSELFSGGPLGFLSAALRPAASQASGVAADLETAAEQAYPTNPFNTKSGTVARGAAQGLSLLAGGVAGKALGLGGALTALPLVSGGLSGVHEGVQKAEDIGVESPEAQLAMGLLFGTVEAGTERMFGLGNKGATDALLDQFKRPAAELLKQAARSIGGEAVEEIAAGSAQDLLTRAFADEDPANPGFTRTGVELPKLDRKMLERRGLEALGGAAGGTIFAGVQTLANTAAAPAPQPVEGEPRSRIFTRRDGTTVQLEFDREPTEQALAEAQNWLDSQPSPNDNLPAGQTPGAAQAPAADQPATAAPPLGAASPQAVSPLISIAQRAGAVDPLLPAHVSDLTAEDIQDLETGRPGDRVARTPILQNVLDAPTLIPATEVQQTTAATTNRDEAGQPPGLEATPATAAAPAETAAVEVKPPQRWRMPITAREDGVTDVLDYMAGEGIKIERPERVQRDRMGRATNALGEHDGMKRLRQQLPAYYRAMTHEAGYKPDEAAQILFEAGVIAAPTPDAITDAIETAVSQRRAIRGKARAERMRMATEERGALRQGQRQNASWNKANAPAKDKVAVPSDEMKPGQTMEVDGEPMTVLEVEYDEDGNWQGALIEDGDRFGRQWIDNGEVVHADAGTVSQSPGPQASPSEFAPDEQGLTNLVIKRDLEAGFMTTAGADALLDLAHTAFKAGQTFVQWSKAMLQRFGESIRQWLAGVWDHAKRSSQTGAVNFTGRLGADLQKAARSPSLQASPSPSLSTAYMAAMQGRSSAMVPIRDVYEQAKAQNPLLTPQQFLAEVEAGDQAGTVLLEPFDTPQGLQQAGPFVVRNGSGVPSINMMVQRGFTHLDVSGQRSQAGFVLNPMPALERLAKAVLPIHTAGQPFRVKDLGMRSILTGSPLPRELVKVLDLTENERQAVMQASAQVGRDLQTAVRAYIDRTGKPDLEVWDRVNDVLEGKPAALSLLNVIDPVLAERSRRARNMLDDLSAAVSQTLPAGDLRTLIAGNMGSWMRRGYAAFDPESGWNFDNVMRAAALGRDIAGKSASQIVANAKALLRAQNPQNGRTQKEWNADIEADMRDLMDRNTWEASLVSGGSTVKKNVGSFMKRKTIPAEIRALMGEETNPLHRFSQSAAFQAQVIARHHGQLAMRSLGLQTGLFSTQRGGVYTQEIPADGSRWSGLAGVWTTPQLWEALGRTSTVNLAGTDLGGKLVDTLKALGNEAKLNRVALNPDSWLVNILGNWASLLQSGDVFAFDFIRRMKEAHQLINSGRAKPGAVWHAAHEAFTDVQRTMLARLRGMGVVGSSVTLNDIEASIPRHLLQWVAEDEARNQGLGAVKGAVMGQALGRGFGMTGRVIGGAAGAVGGAVVGAKQLQEWQIKLTNYVMTGPDALARVTGFLTNYETALAAGMNTDQAAQWASDRTLNTFPNYSALPAPLRQLSRLGFTGSFIAFQWEVYRNYGWNLKYAFDELRSNSAAIQARGLRRLGGVSTIAALAGGGLAALIGLVSGGSGTDDERNKKWRKWFAAPWEKDAVLAFDKFDENGVSYYNTSYLLPQVTMMELIQAAADGKDPAESATRVVDRLSEQFVNGSVHLQPLVSAWMNQDRTGRKLTNREGVEGAMIRADNAMQTILEPGFAAKIERITYALREAEKNGRSYSVEEEMKRLAGVRQVTRTWEELVKRRYSQFTSDYMAERDEANKTLGENLPGAAVRAVDRVNDRVETLTKELQEYELDLRLMGIPETTIARAKKDSNLQHLNPVRVRADGKRVEATTNR